jgi:hypothetical protein
VSLVTGIVLTASCAEDKAIFSEIDQWLEKYGGLGKPLDDFAGGYKHPQVHLYSCGANYLDNEAFAAFVMSREWESPESVVLVLDIEGPDEACVYRPGREPNWWTVTAPSPEA